MSENRFKVQLGIQNMELLRDGWSLGGVLFRKAPNYDASIQSVKRGHLSIITAIAELAVSVPTSERIERAVETAAQQMDAVLLPVSVAQGSFIERTSAGVSVEGSDEIDYTTSFSLPDIQGDATALIDLGDQETFLSQVHPQTSKSEFRKQTLLGIALTWYLQANQQEFEEADFLFRYTALETLAWGFVQHKYSGQATRLITFERSPSQKVRHFLTQIRAPVNAYFAAGNDDLFELRNHIVHRGMAFQRPKPGPLGKQIRALRGLLDWCFLNRLGYRGPFNDARYRWVRRSFPDDVPKFPQP